MPLTKFERIRSTGPVELDRREARQQLLEQDLRLQSRQVRAQAEMRTAWTERDVVVRLARHVEPVGVGEDLLVAVRADVPRDDLVARP